MNRRLFSCLLAVATVSGCTSSGINEGPKPPPAAAEWWPSNPADIDFQAHAIAGGIEIWEDGKPVSRIRGAQPVIERWAFVKNGRQIIVKSRGAEGPATIELFDSRTAIRRDTIPADQVIDGRPAWAAGLAETAR
jgi:hypothetical protein